MDFKPFSHTATSKPTRTLEVAVWEEGLKSMLPLKNLASNSRPPQIVNLPVSKKDK